MKKILISSLLVVLLIVGCGSNKENSDRSYIVGITDGYQLKAWTYVKEQAEKEGIKLEVKEFDSYTLPNRALDSGDIDLNSFQHIVFLNSEVKTNNLKIEAVGKSILEPMALYSKQVKALNELKDGAHIVIPDDVTNQGRALNLLAKAGLITLSTEVEALPALKDIKENPKNFKFTEALANSIPLYLDDVDLAAINGGIAQDARLNIEDAVFQEEVNISSDNPFINVIVARSADKDNADIKRLVELYQSDAVKEIIQTETKGGTYPVW